MGYFASKGLHAIYDVNKRMRVKKKDVTFFKGLLSHSTMEGHELSPGLNILGQQFTAEEIHVPGLVGNNSPDGGEQGNTELRPTPLLPQLQRQSPPSTGSGNTIPKPKNTGSEVITP